MYTVLGQTQVSRDIMESHCLWIVNQKKKSLFMDCKSEEEEEEEARFAIIFTLTQV